MDDHKDDRAKLQAELDAARQQADEYLEGWKRAKADYANLKRDAEKERAELVLFATGSILIELLTIADGFERALAHLSDDQKRQDWVKGILAIQRELQSFFDRVGLKKVASDGTFNPELHEAVTREKRDGAKPGTILNVVENGYTLHGKLLRPAKVAVAE